jgi:hypothetical protein
MNMLDVLGAAMDEEVANLLRVLDTPDAFSVEARSVTLRRRSGGDDPEPIHTFDITISKVGEVRSGDVVRYAWDAVWLDDDGEERDTVMGDVFDHWMTAFRDAEHNCLAAADRVAAE